ncbi:MAG: protein translocase subunit SecF [Pseudomonadota bacterium]
MLLKYWPERTTASFMSKRIPAFILSGVLIIASIFLVITKNLNFGIDFIGGSVIEFAQPDGVSDADVRDYVEPLGFGEVEVTSASGTGLNAPPVFVVKIKTQGATEELDEEEAQQVATDRLVQSIVDAGWLEKKEDLAFRDTVGPKVSNELLWTGITALGVALALMLCYIWFRFVWQYSVGAVAALTHDVILTIGLFSLLQLEFNLSTIAALLTIIGYSMNDTVVVFDRVREELRKYKKMPLDEVMDLALNGTLSRTLITSGTTLLALLAIFFLGGPVLRGMSAALLWGVVIGTYSSIFVASSIVRTIGVPRSKKSLEEVPGFGAT